MEGLKTLRGAYRELRTDIEAHQHLLMINLPIKKTDLTDWRTDTYIAVSDWENKYHDKPRASTYGKAIKRVINTLAKGMIRTIGSQTVYSNALSDEEALEKDIGGLTKELDSLHETNMN